MNKNINFSENIILNNIHIIFIIDETAKILLIFIILDNIIKNVKTLKNIIIYKISNFMLKLDKIIKGIIFWILDRMIKINKDLVFKIEMNQIWKGVTPNFIKILKIINIYILFKNKFNKKNLIKKITEAHLWIKKYFIEFSISICSFEEIIGKNLIIFNSNNIHMRKLEFTLSEIKTDKIIKK